MKITIELPDDLVTCFVNFVHGNIYCLTLGTIAIGDNEKRDGFATYKTCKKKEDADA